MGECPENLGAMEKATGAITRVSAIVVPAKPHLLGVIRVCVCHDNKAITREKHASSKLKHLVTRLTSVSVILQHDRNNGDPQAMLHDASRPIAKFTMTKCVVNGIMSNDSNFGKNAAAELLENTIRRVARIPG